MGNSRNYRVPTGDDDADVPKWNGYLAEDVAKDLDAVQASMLKPDDPRLPEDLAVDNYLEATISPTTHKLLQGIRKDGSVEIPVGRIAGGITSQEASDKYLHAVVTPSRKVLYGIRKTGELEVGGQLYGGGSGTPAPAALPYHVIVVAGQSNATYLDVLPVTVEEADPRLFRWSGTAIEALPAAQSYVGSEFARAYIRSLPPNTARVLIVDTAVGATGFTSTSITPAPAGYHTAAGGTWDRTLTTDPINLASLMLSKVTAALTAAGAGAKLAALVWVQGEDDTQVGSYLYNDPAGVQAAYAAKLDDLLSTARTTWNAPTLPILIGSMTPQFILEYANGTTIREKVGWAHMDTPRRILSSAYVYGPENMERYNDTIHFSSQGNRVRGPMFLEALTRARLNVTTARPLPPINLRASRSGDTVTAKWDAPPARATAFTVEYSIAGGAWTTLPLTVPIALSGTFTAAAGTAVKLRAKTTNETGTTHYTREVAI